MLVSLQREVADECRIEQRIEVAALLRRELGNSGDLGSNHEPNPRASVNDPGAHTGS